RHRSRHRRDRAGAREESVERDAPESARRDGAAAHRCAPHAHPFLQGRMTPMWPLLLSLNATAADYTHAAKPDVHCSIDLWCGSVAFRAGKDLSVRATGELGGLTPTFEGTDKELRFVVPVSDNAAMFRSHDGCDVQLDVTMPEGASIDANSTKGDISVNGIHGVVVLEAIVGDISVLDPGREVRATAVNGDINVSDLRGEAELSTVNGDITLDAPDLQELRAHPGTGATHLRAPKARGL